MRSDRKPLLSLAALAGLTCLSLAVAPATAVAPTAQPTSQPTAGTTYFTRTATYPVFQNAPAGVDPAAPTVAEISAVTEDGRTLVYTDALGKRIGFLDISDPSDPIGLGALSLADLGHADDQPTSVAVVGEHALVVVDESGGDLTEPKGRLDVIRLADRSLVHSVELGGQPDSIAISKDGHYAAIAMENQRDEELTPAGKEEGDLPQLPAGFVQTLDLSLPIGAWAATPLALTQPDGTALPALTAAGLNTPEDPEPEYVSINADNKLALTLQENNGIVVIDLPTRTIEKVFGAGATSVTDIDTKKDALTDQTGSISGAVREPDSIAWVGEDLVATANEGDWLGGSRGWTVFDTTTGTVVWDSGNELEHLATRLGLHNEDRAGKKGVEPEGLAFAEYDGTPYAFVGSERSNFIAVYDMTDPTQPAYRQSLPTTNGPEGLLPIPGRDLIAVSSEEDEAEAGVRSTVALYRFGADAPAWPTIESDDVEGAPIGWGALGALSARPGDPTHLYAASDAAYTRGRIYSVDVTEEPARIDGVIEVREADGTRPALDVEGVFARPGGGFWLAHEGTTGPDNALIRTDPAGVIQERIALPADVSAGLAKWGLEGVTATGSGVTEQVYVALQRPLTAEEASRIGRYDVATGAWSWFAYPLESTGTPGDWIGVSEIVAVNRKTLAVIERDKLNGPAARVKRVYTVHVSRGGTVQQPELLRKRLAVDVLPHLAAPRGWIQEKLEGLTIGADGNVYAITDNDGVKDATGETQLIRLGKAARVLPAASSAR